MSDAIVMRMFKTMGLSESTMVAIEKDLRQQQINAMKAQNEQKKEQQEPKVEK